jgi:hypothetical protein
MFSSDPGSALQLGFGYLWHERGMSNAAYICSESSPHTAWGMPSADKGSAAVWLSLTAPRMSQQMISKV